MRERNGLKGGGKMEELMKKANLTQVELAKRLGVSSRLVSYWCKKERKPNILILPNLSNILGVSVDEIIACFKNKN